MPSAEHSIPTFVATQHQKTTNAKVFYQALLVRGCYKSTPC